MGWLYVPGSEASNSDSDSHSVPPIPQSATWRGTSIAPRSWRNAWKRGSWIKLLSGLTLKPSAASLGVESFIASLEESPASPGAGLVSTEAPKTTDGSGATSRGSWATFLPQSSSWRTSQIWLWEDSNTSLHSWPQAASLRSGIVFKRRMSEHRRNVRGSSSSRWPTPSARDWRSGLASEATHLRNSRPLNESACLFSLLHQTDPKILDPVLNPAFVEGLQGFPLGWTGFTHLETRLFRSWLLTHSMFYSLESKKETDDAKAL